MFLASLGVTTIQTNTFASRKFWAIIYCGMMGYMYGFILMKCKLSFDDIGCGQLLLHFLFLHFQELYSQKWHFQIFPANLPSKSSWQIFLAVFSFDLYTSKNHTFESVWAKCSTGPFAFVSNKEWSRQAISENVCKATILNVGYLHLILEQCSFWTAKNRAFLS